jgi:KH domain-containing protein
MKTIISEKLPRIIKNKKKLEKELNVKITNRGKEVFINGTSENEYLSEKVIDALNFGFPFSACMSIKKDDFIFEIFNIKDYSKRHDLKTIRARIIGKGGKTLKVLSDLSNCYIELKNNEIGIIGSPLDIENAHNAVVSIIKGAKQTNVYGYLEKHKIKNISDLGLKN